MRAYCLYCRYHKQTRAEISCHHSSNVSYFRNYFSPLTVATIRPAGIINQKNDCPHFAWTWWRVLLLYPLKMRRIDRNLKTLKSFEEFRNDHEDNTIVIDTTASKVIFSDTESTHGNR